MFVRAPWQQAAAGAIRAGVELDPKHAHRIQTKAQRAGRKPRLQLQQEALSPLAAPGLGGRVTVKITIEVEVTQLQTAFSIVDKTGLDR